MLVLVSGHQEKWSKLCYHNFDFRPPKEKQNSWNMVTADVNSSCFKTLAFS